MSSGEIRELLAEQLAEWQYLSCQTVTRLLLFHTWMIKAQDEQKLHFAVRETCC